MSMYHKIFEIMACDVHFGKYMTKNLRNLIFGLSFKIKRVPKMYFYFFFRLNANNFPQEKSCPICGNMLIIQYMKNVSKGTFDIT